MFEFVVIALATIFILMVIYYVANAVLRHSADRKADKVKEKIIELCRKYPEAEAKIKRHGKMRFVYGLEAVENSSAAFGSMSEEDRAAFSALAAEYRQWDKKALNYWSNYNSTSATPACTSSGKDAGKEASKQVIKSAVIGAVIAGDAGAVVGATAAKAAQDAKAAGSNSDGKAERNEVIKKAVIGGVIAGDTGAIVGAAAAKAAQDARNREE